MHAFMTVFLDCTVKVTGITERLHVAKTMDMIVRLYGRDFELKT